MKTHAALFICVCLLLSGCGSDSPEKVGLDDMEQFGELPYLSATRNPQLADELARIREEGGTPEQLTPADGEDSVGAALKELFPKEQLETLSARAEELMPPRRFQFDPTQLQHVIAFRRKYDRERLASREALRRPQRHLGIRFVAGFAADTSVIDAVRLCARLEAFHAADRLADDDLDGALDAVGQMLAWAGFLGAQKHLDARLHAAFLRAEALAVMHAVATHADAAREHLQALLQMTRAQLEAWPDDAGAWIGERAMGLHSYELVREGALLLLLTEAEVEEFRREGDLRVVAAAARRHADRDQLYYLDTMRRVIQACGKPYHDRRPLLESINLDLQTRWGTPDYPLVAGRLLLKNLAAAHSMKALDRANWEAWSLALAVATGESPPPLVSPLTGRSYDVVRDDGRIVVSGIGAGSDAEQLQLSLPDLAPR
ncbi:MAG: hypothetical protein ACOCWL_00125 [Thermoguttaceae bacterium]